MPPRSLLASAASVVILVADGARPDTLGGAMDDGTLPALRRLREEGELHTVTSTFPSVTGPAYTPFLTGRYPGSLGLPGLRWLDRGRERASFPDYTRSYVGHGVRHIDGDMTGEARTLFELVPRSIGAMSMVSRGLARRDHVGTNVRDMLRGARAHFSGRLDRWLAIDRDVAVRLARRVRETHPPLVFAAMLAVDKVSHAEGHDSPRSREAMRIVDSAAAEIRHDAERDGRWEQMRLWIVSDHGHSRVRTHDDIAAAVAEAGHRALSHPWVYSLLPSDVGVMVSGNAMAHLYLDPARRARHGWPTHESRWEPLVRLLLARDSVDLLMLPHDDGRCEIRGRGRGAATLEWTVGADGARPRYTYRRLDGDPLALGADLVSLDAREAYDATIAGDYPDALVQIAQLAGARRSGEIILSASRDWDFRAHYEPIPHVSSHGALHREHMLVPLLLSRAEPGTPRRTVDVMPSVLRALGHAIPPRLDGESFV